MTRRCPTIFRWVNGDKLFTLILKHLLLGYQSSRSSIFNVFMGSGGRDLIIF